MKTYNVEIEEILSRVVTVEANSKEEAEDMVLQKYKDQEIILDDGDYNGEPNIRTLE